MNKKDEALLNMRSLIEKIVAIAGVDAVDLKSLKDHIIKLAYEVDKYEEE